MSQVRRRLTREELRMIYEIIKNTMDQLGVNAKKICAETGVGESEFSKLKNKQSAMVVESIVKILNFLSITEADLESHGLQEDAIRKIFGPGKRIIISGVLTENEGAWVYETLTGEIVFAHGSPRALIEKKILEDLSRRLKVFLDNNLT